MASSRENHSPNKQTESEKSSSMKKQNSLKPSSNSHLEISSDDLRRRSLRRRNSKSFGCVSGLLHFLSTASRHTSKSITFVHTQNQELGDPIPPPPKPEFAAGSDSDPQISGRSESGMWRFGGAIGPIVRLMGLEEVPAAAEKQREVMAALERCERDLKALKDFIDSSESFRSSAPAGEGKKVEFLAWEPSPVTLHFVNRHGCNNSGRVQLHQRQELQRKNPREEGILNLNKIDKFKTNEELVGKCKNESLSPLCSSSKAIMRDIVEGISKDIAWGQKREVERIVLALQHQICSDLIEELVKDSIFSYSFSYSSLPFEACKRRLCF